MDRSIGPDFKFQTGPKFLRGTGPVRSFQIENPDRNSDNTEVFKKFFQSGLRTEQRKIRTTDWTSENPDQKIQIKDHRPEFENPDQKISTNFLTQTGPGNHGGATPS